MLIICCSFFRVLIKEVGKIGAKVGRMYKKMVHVYVLMFLGFIADGSLLSSYGSADRNDVPGYPYGFPSDIVG